MKTIIARNKIIRLNVKYEVMEKCVNQTSGNSTEHFEIWCANKQSSGFTKALKSVVNLMSCTNSVEEHKEITAICTSRPVNTTGTEATDYNCSSPIFSRIHHVDLGVKFDSIECIETTEVVGEMRVRDHFTHPTHPTLKPAHFTQPTLFSLARQISVATHPTLK